MIRKYSDDRQEQKLAYGLNEAAAISGLSRSTLYKLIKAGTLPSVKIAGRRLIRRHDLVAILNGEEARGD